MARRRRLKLTYLLGSLLLLGTSLHSPTAYSAPGDPPSGSPAGAVYELPLERGRADGAPKGGGGTAAGGGDSVGATADGGGAAAGEDGSLYRTENNFGSSSEVPGLAAAGGGGGPGGGSGGPGGGSGGPGDAAAGGGVGGAIAGGAVAGDVTDSGNTSISASLVLLGAVALLATAVGLLSRRAVPTRR
jgi:hypothetical protein